MKRKTINVIFSLLSAVVIGTGTAFASPAISDSALAQIDEFMNFRMKLSVYKTPEEALKAIDDYEESHKEAVENFGEQEKLIYEDFVLLERYNYLREDKKNDAYLKKVLLAQAEKNDAFFAANKASEIDEWLYVISADTYSCYMSFNPVGGALKYGMKLKKNYEECLKINPDNSYCLTHLAQWYYWAPGINGGSKQKAQVNFEKAVTAARNSGERYYAYIFLSQFLYEKKNKDKCAELLQEALKEEPNSTYVQLLQKVNKQGYSLFTYNEKQARDEGRVSE